MRVLLAHSFFPPHFAGGGEYVLLETARDLQKAGVSVRVLCSGDPRIDQYEGIPTQRLPVHPYRLNFARRAIEQAARDVDIVHTFTYHAALASYAAARSLGKPVACMIMGLFRRTWIDMKGPIVGRAAIAYESHILRRRYDCVIFPSEQTRDTGVSMGVDARRSCVLNPGIHVEDYAPAAQKDVDVLFVGKFDARKGLEDVLHVARAVPDKRFVLFGFGREQDGWRSEAPANVEVVPFQRGQPLTQVFGRAKVFLFPSRAETFGLAVVEAMASGCSIVSTLPIGYRGVVVRPGDVDAMTRGVRQLLGDPVAAAEMGRENIELSRQYTWDVYTSGLLRQYERMLGSTRLA